MDIPEQINIELEAIGGMDALIEQLPLESDIIGQSLIHKALSSPIRLTILNMLAIQPLCVCVIQKIVKTSPSKLSYHLSILSDNKLIESKREASWLIYDLTELGREFVMK
ncbi:metalloregulator ArsR/SmtB family transcription factor [Methanolobus sp. ZRKC3]|uniref:ArsR/SmtB family transcription factor n=1 Tax=Methanolobus sp. ZRKC3 TaxID=3125786 RepID=UPI003253AB71